VLNLPFDGLESFTEVQRMARCAVFGEFEDVRLDAFADQHFWRDTAIVPRFVRDARVNVQPTAEP
jgi:hypothetical protein